MNKTPVNNFYITFAKSMWRMLFILFVILCSSSCTLQNSAFEDNPNKIKVTATTGMIADLVRQIGQDHVQVVGLMGPGVDPHLYKASFGDIQKIDEAQLVFYNGLHLEGKMDEIFKKISKHKPVIAISKDIPKQKLRMIDNLDSKVDPHIWFDVKLWMTAANSVRNALIQFDPSNQQIYESHTESYLSKLLELDHYASEQISSIPLKSRILITGHDAFGYFGDSYHMQVKGLQGISTASDYGTKDIIELRNFIVEQHLKAVFVESSVNKKSIQAIIEGAKSLGHEVRIGGNLYSDALGPIDSNASTYIGMFKSNIDTIVNSLR